MTERAPASTAPDPLAADVAALAAGELGDPHRLLGPHSTAKGTAVRAWRPDAEAVTLTLDDGRRLPMDQLHFAGAFAARVEGTAVTDLPSYRFEVAYPGGSTFVLDDPYRFWPTLGDLDLHLFGEGRHHALWRHLGAHPREHQGVHGTAFAVWAPAAHSVRVVGDFNSWDGRLHPMRALGSSGVWELFLPGIGPGACYKFEVLDANGAIQLKTDPFAFATEAPPATASVVNASSYEWHDAQWLKQRAATDPLRRPLSVYEVHLGSWRRVPEDGDRSLTYRELAEQLPEYVAEMGFTHVELLPVAEHPFTGSWGYQVSCYYAPTARYGSPDDFRALVDALHARGIGIIVDWVPAHFPKDQFALARFDGTALYEHADPRQGEHPDWGTLVFNFGRHEVRNFLVANALYWIEEFHIDGLRVDAVASMLYLDYSRKQGEWVPNRFGGRENLDAVEFLKDLNTVVYGAHPGVMTVAEESTAWPAVSKPTYVGGLGFGFKWNMGWMHDTLQYFSKDAVHRRHHHHQLTFGLLYAFSENFVLPLSHDEVVHGKGSLVGKMPGERHVQLANLRALLAWMWAHPGSRLLFMGGELAQVQEWSHDRSLDWHLLDDPGHAGVQALVRTLNHLAVTHPAIWELEYDPAGFRWIDANDADQNVLSFARFSADGSRVVVCVANLSGLHRGGYRIGVPRPGRWEQLLDTASTAFGGDNPEQIADRWAEPVSWHGLAQSLALDLAPFSVVWLSSAE
jgi:1,4-alpha-glucan branching enzyme